MARDSVILGAELVLMRPKALQKMKGRDAGAWLDACCWIIHLIFAVSLTEVHVQGFEINCIQWACRRQTPNCSFACAGGFKSRVCVMRWT